MNNSDIHKADVFEQPQVRREKESVDDFEHLGLDISPTQGDIDIGPSSVSFAARDLLEKIDKTAENVDEIHKQPNLFLNTLSSKMDSNVFEMGDTLSEKAIDADDKMDKYISQLSFAPPVPSHQVSPIIENRKPQYNGIQNFLEMEREMFVNAPAEPIKHAANIDFSEPVVRDSSFSNTESLIKESEIPVAENLKKEESQISFDLISETVATSECNIEPVFAEKPPKIIAIALEPQGDTTLSHKTASELASTAPEVFHNKVIQPEMEPTIVKPLKSNAQLEPNITDADAIFKKLVLEEHVMPATETILESSQPSKVATQVTSSDEEEFRSPFQPTLVPSHTDAEVIFKKLGLEKHVMPATETILESSQPSKSDEEEFRSPYQPILAPTVKPLKYDALLEPSHTDAEVIFKKLGLDAWFHPERLNPRVESLIYWRDPTKSGPVFGGVLVILLALTYLSLISVIAYLSLLALTATISFRIYKNVLQAVQKTGDGHPFKEFLDMDITLPQEKVREIVDTAIAHLNAGGIELRRLFLVDDLVDSIKFGVLLWCLTYLGAWFNGMTLVLIAWVALFTLPKVYETNKTQIDANLDLVRSKIADITTKVKAAIPIGKKEEKKEQ